MKVLVTGMRAPSACHLADMLKGEVLRGDCIRFPLRPSLRFPSPQHQFTAFQGWVKDTIRSQKIDCVIPTCEDVIHTRQALEDSGMEDFIFAPSSKMLVRMHDKYAFVQAMKEWGLSVPETRLFEKGEGRAEDLVYKPRVSRFGEHVSVGVEPAKADGGWIRQERCRGIEGCVYALGHEGKLCGFKAYRPVVRAGQGAGIGLRSFEVPGLRGHLDRFMEASGWTGQVSFDFFYDGAITFIECNPRTTSGVHWFGDISPALRGEWVDPVRSGSLQVGMAMPLFGKRTGRYKAMRRAPDVMEKPLGGVAQLLTFAELVARGKREGMSVLGSATWGIVHKGPYLA